MKPALIAATALLLVACSGEPDEPMDMSPAPVESSEAEEDDAAMAGAAPGDGPVWVAVDGETQDLELDICSIDSIYDTPDPRQMTAVGAGGFPSFDFTHLPPDTVSAEFTDAEGVNRYRTNQPEDFEVTITPAGASGTIAMTSLTGQAPDVTVEFEFTCPEAGTDDGTAASEDDASSEDTASGGGTKTGYVEWAGARSDLDDADFDPQAGTGLCETQDVTGLEEGDYYRIVTQLDDGTDFSLTSRDGLQLGDTFNPIETTIADLTQDGRTVSGSADTPTGPIDFSFTC